MKLYRGITVSEEDADEVMEQIATIGVEANVKTSWSPVQLKNLKPDLKVLFANQELTLEVTRPSKWIKNRGGGGHNEPIGCDSYMCFADYHGATYYAAVHNRTENKNKGLVIEVEVDPATVIVDGKDFLFSVVSMMNANNKEVINKHIDKLTEVYGVKIIDYISKIYDNPGSNKFAICDLAVQDPDVVKAHFQNELMLRGRYGVTFRSAFFVAVPVDASSVISVNAVNESFIPRDYDLAIESIVNDFR